MSLLSFITIISTLSIAYSAGFPAVKADGAAITTFPNDHVGVMKWENNRLKDVRGVGTIFKVVPFDDQGTPKKKVYVITCAHNVGDPDSGRMKFIKYPKNPKQGRSANNMKFYRAINAGYGAIPDETAPDFPDTSLNRVIAGAYASGDRSIDWAALEFIVPAAAVPDDFQEITIKAVPLLDKQFTSARIEFDPTDCKYKYHPQLQSLLSSRSQRNPSTDNSGAPSTVQWHSDLPESKGGTGHKWKIITYKDLVDKTKPYLQREKPLHLVKEEQPPRFRRGTKPTLQSKAKEVYGDQTNTETGQSGSPIFDEQNNIRAIHTESKEACIITEDIKKRIDDFTGNSVNAKAYKHEFKEDESVRAVALRHDVFIESDDESDDGYFADDYMVDMDKQRHHIVTNDDAYNKGYYDGLLTFTTIAALLLILGICGIISCVGGGCTAYFIKGRIKKRDSSHEQLQRFRIDNNESC